MRFVRVLAAGFLGAATTACGAKTALEADRPAPPDEFCATDADGDGFAPRSCGADDCDDARADVSPSAPEACRNGLDDDCDGDFDCSDRDCLSECAPCSPERCGGVADEDCDGLFDCADPDCAVECCAGMGEVCNGLDDDCDGAPDDGLECFFADGVVVEPIRATTCGADWYSYGDPDSSSANPVPDVRASGVVTVGFVTHPPGCGGASVAVITDIPGDGTGGELVGRFTLYPEDAGAILLSDERRECVHDLDAGTVECEWEWEPCCGDGIVLGRFPPTFCVTVELSDPNGLSALRVLTAGGRHEDRRGARGRVELCGRTVAPR